MPEPMRAPNIELRHLRYFVAVAERESISRAAHDLNVSQPPLSRQIRDLESELGVALFERESRRLTLTPAGEIFLREARAILQRFGDGVALTRELCNRDCQIIRVGHSSASSIQALPQILRSFQNLHPAAKVELRRLPTHEMVQGLRRGELDVCLTIGGSASDLAEFHVEKLSSYSLLGAVCKQHSFASMDKIPLTAFAQEPVLSLRRAAFSWYNEFIGDVLLPHNPRFTVAEEHEGSEAVIAAVEAGRGVALVYDVMTQTLQNRVVVRDLIPTPPRAPLILFRRMESGRSLIGSFFEAATSVKR